VTRDAKHGDQLCQIGAPVNATDVLRRNLDWERVTESSVINRTIMSAVVLSALALPIAIQTVSTPANAAQREKIAVPSLRMKGVRVERRGAHVVVGMRGRILFDYDRARLRPNAYATLARIAAALQQYYPYSPLRIVGHTDSHGDAAYNYRLSRARASSVLQGFQQYGIPYHRLQIVGYGETRPIAPNSFPDGRDNPAGRQANRRVEIVVLWPYRRPYPHNRFKRRGGQQHMRKPQR